jgi:raffinose/stachyose/melibiose transport system permease protein
MSRTDTKAVVRRRSARALTYLSMILGCAVVLLPLLAALAASLKTSDELNTTNPLALPKNLFNFSNYTDAFAKGDMATAFLNTMIILVISVTGTVFIGTMAAYAINRFDFRAKRGILFLFLLAAVVPPVTTNVATFQIINGLNLFNTRWALIALFLGTDIVSIYIFLQFLRTIPKALDEAALIDGASYFRVYRSIILPLMKPAIATVVIIKSVAIYNEFYLPFLYLPDPDQRVVSTSLFKFKGPYGTHWELISAGAIIIIIPTLVLFLALQRYIYNGFASGATK